MRGPLATASGRLRERLSGARRNIHIYIYIYIQGSARWETAAPEKAVEKQLCIYIYMYIHIYIYI